MQTQLFEIHRQELLNRLTRTFTEDTILKTEIGSLRFYRSTKATEFMTTLYEPSLCIAIQGSKAIGIGDEMFSYNPYTYLLASTYLPARVKIEEASEEAPYFALVLDFSMEQIFEVLKEMNERASKKTEKTERGLCFEEMSVKLIEPIVRLTRLLDSPKDIPIIAPLITKEILYIVMQGRGGDFIRQYIMEGNAVQRIASVIASIKNSFSQTLNIEALAKSAGMSESSLYHNFKKITTMSPLQFQKSLRLKEARHMLLTQNIEASQVAFDVGYESPSQFSREYARMFGLPPKSDIKRLRDDY